MAAHRYWRATNIEAYGVAGLDITEFQLLAGTARVDASAALTSNVAPATGSLANLKDDDTTTGATWGAQELKTLVLSWDFGSSGDVAVTDIRIGAAAEASRFLLIARIQFSDDGTTWTEWATATGIAWPGARAKTSSNPGPLDPAGTLVLIHFDGANGASSATDVKGRAVTFRAGAVLSTSSPKFGSAALSLGGTGRGDGLGPTQDGVQVAGGDSLAFGASDFTLEGWVYRSITPISFAVLWDFRPIGTNGLYPTLYVNASNRLALNVNGADVIAQSSGSVPLNTWAHVALSRASGVTRLFLDGVQVGSNYVDANSYLAAPTITIGASGYDLVNGGWGGKLDEFRFSRGGLYGANFTPPAEPFGGGILVNRVQGRAAPVAVLRVPTATSQSLPYGQTKVAQVVKGRNDYLTGVLGQGIGRVRGFTLDYVNPLNKPYPCRVRLMREADGLVVRELWSGADGSYDFQWIDELQSYTVLAYYLAHGKLAVVTDGLTLANGKVELMP
ncbi:LamG domain-containing protein [Variovorax sp. Root434]|uniref:LamG domain-containing protein n=1 Tax=Variovorax sp. Root434 TaxID=1736536 RepID=UPI0006F438DF|nr:LamG domain-containing protein [Variovorax sp. Root434]KQX34687.1 hypothetical protein ASD05_25900 [Variovorax sp. Root434]